MIAMEPKLKEKLELLPAKSGVYVMQDSASHIIYVGKAKNLKNRVRSYFRTDCSKSQKTMKLVEKIADFYYIVTANEIEALILENNLIKEHKPYYNILLKDDRAYPYIKVALREKFPSLTITRRIAQDGSRYFGPYMVGVSATEILELAHSAFPIRSCNLKEKKAGRVCLNYHLGRCLAPCAGKVTEEEYSAVIKKAMRFLSGEDKEVAESLTARLTTASEAQQYELAIGYRDALASLNKIVRRQVAELSRDIDMDIFAYAENGARGVVNQMVIRGGKLLGAENYEVGGPLGDSIEGDALTTFIMQYYDKNPLLVNEVILHSAETFTEELQTYLTEKKGSKVVVSVPQISIKRELADMSYKNAREHLERTVEATLRREQLTHGSAELLSQILGLPRPARRIECFDISHIQGADTVASMTVFTWGAPDKKAYRRFKVRTVEGVDDFASMTEILTRRIANIGGEDASLSLVPDLVVIDGGKGQLSSVSALLSKIDVPVIGLAKRYEEVFLPNKSAPVILSRDNGALKLLQRIRDEAHRFAISYHRVLRGKRQTKSALTDIAGVGPKTARALLTRYKNIDAIKTASADDLAKTEGVTRRASQSLYNYFNGGTHEI